MGDRQQHFLIPNYTTMPPPPPPLGLGMSIRTSRKKQALPYGVCTLPESSVFFNIILIPLRPEAEPLSANPHAQWLRFSPNRKPSARPRRGLPAVGHWAFEYVSNSVFVFPPAAQLFGFYNCRFNTPIVRVSSSINSVAINVPCRFVSDVQCGMKVVLKV